MLLLATTVKATGEHPSARAGPPPVKRGSTLNEDLSSRESGFLPSPGEPPVRRAGNSSVLLMGTFPVTYAGRARVVTGICKGAARMTSHQIDTGHNKF